MNRLYGPGKTASNVLYALAAGAVGVSVLALTQPAEAKIVYTSAHVIISGFGGYYKLDLNHDGITDFSITCNCSQEGQMLAAQPAAKGNGIVGSGGFAAALQQGTGIGPTQTVITGPAEMENVSNGHCYTGNWCNVANRYLGLKFITKGKTRYGWARLSVQIVGGRNIVATLTGYAFETIPGKSIIAGRTKGPADEAGEEDFGPGASLTSSIPVTPHPASLGTLALGAEGVPLWRRKESEG
jgi:hypothetical protein